MLIGMDVGGTNTDIAMVDGKIISVKISNDRGISAALNEITRPGRLAVSTSQPLNRLLTGPPRRCRTLLIPGPGLFWPGAVSGAVNHRGDVVERIDPGEVKRSLSQDRGDVLAIAGKFSVRNPVQEMEVRNLAMEWYPDTSISMSHPLAALDFPARVATTRLNAMLKETVSGLAGRIREQRADFLFFRGDGGLTAPGAAVDDPSSLIHSSAAAVASGAYYLTGEKDCLVVDIGGTTTDLVPLSDGSPVVETLVSDGEITMARTVQAASLPYGGDSRIDGGLHPHRLGNALAFGGPAPTLTDALNAAGASIGDTARSSVVGGDEAGIALETYLSLVSGAVRESGKRTIVGTGYLAPLLIPEIARRSGVASIVPPHAECANAVGVAVSKVSLVLYARFDSGRKKVVYNGEVSRLDTMPGDEDLVEQCRNEVRSRALHTGAHPDDVRDVDLLRFHEYNVIRGGHRAERIADVVVQIKPGITAEAL